MHLFVFQNTKHNEDYRWRRPKRKLNSYRGNFDLERIRAGCKMNYTLTGFGDHDLHKLTEKVSLNLFKGHLLEVEDPKDAMWIKLNYDMIGRAGTTFQGLYRDLDIQVIREKVREIMEHESQSNEHVRSRNSMNMLTRALYDFDRSKVIRYDEAGLQAAFDGASELREKTLAITDFNNKQMEFHSNHIGRLKREIIEYVASKKTGS